MIGKRFVQAVADEPTDRQVDLCLAQQSSVVRDPEQKAGQHEPNRHFRINSWAPVACAIESANFIMQPRKIENSVNANQDVIVRNELS